MGNHSWNGDKQQIKSPNYNLNNISNGGSALMDQKKIKWRNQNRRGTASL